MESVFTLLDTREQLLRAKLSKAREGLAEAQKQVDGVVDELDRLAVTRETMADLLPDEDVFQAAGANQDSDTHAAYETQDDRAARAHSSADETPVGPPLGDVDLKAARAGMLSLLATVGRAVKVQDIAAGIGERRVETTRSRLKKMAIEGLVVEGPTAYFAIVPGDDQGDRGNPGPEEGDAVR